MSGISKEAIENCRAKFLEEAKNDTDTYHPNDIERVKTNDWTVERFLWAAKGEICKRLWIKTKKYQKS